MADIAAHWMDFVLPDIPMRQWVLTLPFQLRYLLAYDADLVTDVLNAFLRTLFAWQRRRAKRSGIDARSRDIRTGAVTGIQRFGSALNLNVHFHTIAFDGVYVRTSEHSQPAFFPLPAPTDGEVAHLAAAVRQRIRRMLRRKGRLPEDGEADSAPDLLYLDEPTLAECYGASVQGRIATGHRAGQRVERYGGLPGTPWVDVESTRCARVDGFNLHADVAVPAGKRERLERLCRYVLRPAIASERVTDTGDGKIGYELKRPWSDGTTHVVFEQTELIEKLAALVPTPKKNLVRYHGVLAPNTAWRSLVVPGAEIKREPVSQPTTSECTPESAPNRRSSRRTWAELMLRVFAIDVLACGCGGRARVISVITQPRVVRAFLKSIGLPEHAPRPAPARAPPFRDFG